MLHMVTGKAAHVSSRHPFDGNGSGCRNGLLAVRRTLGLENSKGLGIDAVTQISYELPKPISEVVDILTEVGNGDGRRWRYGRHRDAAVSTGC
jgi:hypothetical protein